MIPVTSVAGRQWPDELGNVWTECCPLWGKKECGLGCVARVVKSPGRVHSPRLRQGIGREKKRACECPHFIPATITFDLTRWGSALLPHPSCNQVCLCYQCSSLMYPDSTINQANRKQWQFYSQVCFRWHCALPVEEWARCGSCHFCPVCHLLGVLPSTLTLWAFTQSLGDTGYTLAALLLSLF